MNLRTLSKESVCFGRNHSEKEGLRPFFFFGREKIIWSRTARLFSLGNSPGSIARNGTGIIAPKSIPQMG